MSSTGYRLVHELDERLLAELKELYEGEWWTRGRAPLDLERMCAGSDLCFLLCREDTGALAAFARVLTDGIYKAMVLDVIVAPAERGTGLGRQLMQRILDHPRLVDVAHTELYCLPEMVPFYGKWDFERAENDEVFLRRSGPRP